MLSKNLVSSEALDKLCKLGSISMLEHSIFESLIIQVTLIAT